jgi:polyisoprenoid-binding protein YceI
MQSNRPTRPGRRPLAIAAGIVLVAILAGGGYGIWYLFLRPAGPPPVSEASFAPLPTSSGGSAATLPASGVDGTWKVDTSIGSFADFTDSFVGYRVQEQLGSIGANTAVGRTPNVSGSLTIAGTKVTSATITADLTALQSDDQRRDGQLARQGIETSQFPTATFNLTSPIDLGSIPGDGQQVTVDATGQLTLHGQTKDEKIALKARRSGSVIEISGSLEIAFADYGIQKPTSFAVLSIADTGTIELQLFFSHA